MKEIYTKPVSQVEEFETVDIMTMSNIEQGEVED